MNLVNIARDPATGLPFLERPQRNVREPRQLGAGQPASLAQPGDADGNRR
jgi:hypothetical protein